MIFRSIAIASALTLASVASAEDGLIRMKLQKRSDHEMVAQHLQRENEALKLALEGKSHVADMAKKASKVVLRGSNEQDTFQEQVEVAEGKSENIIIKDYA